MNLKLTRRRRSERGAVAVIFATLVVVLLGCAALGVDIAQQVARKHLLIGQLDASATAAASQLGNNGGISGAVGAASTYFSKNGEGTLDVHNVDFWCVVARKLNGDGSPLEPAMVADLQIPKTNQGAGECNPDAASASTTWKKSDYQNRTRSWDGQKFSMSCSATLCAVPCALNASPTNGWSAGLSLANNKPILCNTIRVGAEQGVPFSFAPVIGVDEGSTGAQIAVACAGPCGSVAPNPMDVVVVADRTLSMTEPLGCTYSGSKSSCTADYREDLVTGIKSMLQVMTPEQQYVALGALGPSQLTRATAEGKACTSGSSAQGLIYPSNSPSTSASGSWVPMTFKNDYLGAADSNGVRALSSTSKLVKAIECLDDVDSTREGRLVNTRTALASPLKAAARYLLGKPGDENNIAALGGASRRGSVKKVIIFETDGEPFENSTTTTGTVSLDNSSDIFSKYDDFTTSGPTASGPVLGGTTNGTPNNLSPAPPSPYHQSSHYPAKFTYSNKDYTFTYKYRTNTTTQNYTRVATGGQKACQNFKAVADLAKAAGIAVITIGYNLDSTTMCSASNAVSAPATTTDSTGTPWISDISPSECRASGSGTQASPYVHKPSCAKATTVTYTVPQQQSKYAVANGTGDASVTSVLAQASGGPDAPTAVSNGCSTTALIAAENSDDDLFFCAAQGQDLAPLFVTALSTVTTGVKLMKLPQ